MKEVFRLFPALLPEIPAFAKVPSSAVVFSTLTPTALAAGAALFMDSLNFSMSRAEVEKDLAITSVTLPVSSAVSPNPPNVAPATAAASASSVPDAAASARVDAVALSIAVASNPNLANSVCSSVTSAAVKAVVAPNSLAESLSISIDSLVPPSPNIACKLLLAFSNPEKIPITLPITRPKPAIPAVMPNAPSPVDKEPLTFCNAKP